jgi:hypothetical protein
MQRQRRVRRAATEFGGGCNRRCRAAANNLALQHTTLQHTTMHCNIQPCIATYNHALQHTYGGNRYKDPNAPAAGAKGGKPPAKGATEFEQEDENEDPHPCACARLPRSPTRGRTRVHRARDSLLRAGVRCAIDARTDTPWARAGGLYCCWQVRWGGDVPQVRSLISAPNQPTPAHAAAAAPQAV